MRLPELGAHRSALATAGAIAAVVAVVAGVAVVSGGYAAQRVDLGDAAVWVVNDGRQAVGRANTAVLELNSVVETGGTAAEVVQQGSTVLVLDRDRATVGIVDATTSTVTKSVAVPPEDTAVALAGDRVVVAAGGDVWSTPVDAFTDFDGDADPVLTFGAGAVTSVDPAGVLFAYTPSTGRVARVDAADEETVAASWQLPPAEDDADVQITSVDEHWVVLDTTARILWIEGREVDLAGVLEPTDDPILQAPSLEGGSVAIAHRRGLVSVGLDGSAPVVLADDVSGDPSAPIQHDGCLNAAWPRRGAARLSRRASPVVSSSLEATGAGAARLPRERRRAGAERSPQRQDLGGIRRLRAHRQLGRPARERAGRRDDRAERPRDRARRSRRPRCRRSPSTTSSARGRGGRRCSRCSSTTTTRTATSSSWTASTASCRPARGSTWCRTTSSCS